MTDLTSSTVLDEQYTQLTPVGAVWNSTTKTCLFSVWAPHATAIHVEIVNNSAVYELKPTRFGYWQAEIDSVQPGNTYYFIINDRVKKPDPASRFQPEGVHGASEIVNSYYPWEDHHWKGLSLEDMIIYELHPGAFSGEGTFEGIISHLDHLIDLGINTLELMPIAQFPGSRNWGYDGVYPFAVQNSYGGPEKLKKLVNACHQRGLAVLLDVVYNHLGPEGNYLADYGPYFTEKYQTPWGKAINFDDSYCDGVRNYFIQNALMWMEDYHLDGLRLDAVHAIYDFGALHIMEALKEKVEQLSKTINRELILVAESDLNDARYISPRKQGGYGLDGQWCDDFHHSVHSLVTGERKGYYEDFGSVNHLAKAFKSSFVYNGNYSHYRKRSYGNSTDALPYSRFVGCIQNHDQVGNRLAGDRLSTLLSYEKLKVSAAALLVAPHVPMLFMGEEYAEENPFQYFISHGDPQLVEAVRKGRQREFSSFQWEGDIPDPQAEETFHQCKLNWNFHDDEKHATMFRWYKHLIELRKKHPALQSRLRTDLEVSADDDKNVLTLKRTCNNNSLLFVFNFSSQDQFFSFPSSKKNGEKIVDSSDPKWLGKGSKSPNNQEPDTQGLISSESVIAYELTN